MIGTPINCIVPPWQVCLQGGYNYNWYGGNDGHVAKANVPQQTLWPCSLVGCTEWEPSIIFATARRELALLDIMLHVQLNVIWIQVIDDVYDWFGHLLRDLDLVWLDTESFAAAVHAKEHPLQQCFWFINGTVQPITRPIVIQRIMYSGHKRVHCIRFQVYSFV